LDEDEPALEEDRVGRRLECEERRAKVDEDVDEDFGGFEVEVDGG
jgi:hypothetical protein